MIGKSINNVYQRLLDDLEVHNIRYALIRDDITVEVYIKELDILIDYKEIEKFHYIAKKQNFFLIKDGYLNPSKKVYLKVENGRVFILDVHERMIHRSIEFMDGKKLLDRRFREKNYYRLSNEDFVLSLIFHNILAKKKIQDKHYEKIYKLLKGSIDLSYIRKHMQNYGLYTIFQEIAENFVNMYNNEKLIRKLSYKAICTLILRRPFNILCFITIYIRRYTVKLWGKRRGILVTFMGPDGSGKSTIVKAVQNRLREIGLTCDTVYLGPWGQSVLQLRKIFRWLNPNPYREDYKAYYMGERESKPGPLGRMKKIKLQMRSTLYYILVVIEMWVRWWGRVLPKLRQSRVVLADRYIYDMLTGYKSLPMDYHIAIRKKICDLFPRPDIGILLDSEPETIIARKDQLTLVQLAHIIDSYREVAQEYDFKVLDTNRDIVTTLIDFEENILPEILARINAEKEINLSRKIC